MSKHQEQRKAMTTQEKEKLKDINRVQHQHKRKKLSNENKIRQRGIHRTQKEKRRKSLSAEEIAKGKQKNKQQHKSKRTDRTSMFQSYEPDMRTTHEAVQNIVTKYFKTIQDGPTYECCVCTRFLYRTSVKHVSDNLISQSSTVLCMNKCQWICITCANSLTKKKIPLQASVNNLRVIEVPQSLKTLSSLEKQLVSKIIPFMKILSLPKGAQHGLKGQVVLVPSNVQQTVSSLPRNTSDSQIIALHLKRRLSDKATFSKQYIRPVC